MQKAVLIFVIFFKLAFASTQETTPRYKTIRIRQTVSTIPKFHQKNKSKNKYSCRMSSGFKKKTIWVKKQIQISPSPLPALRPAESASFIAPVKKDCDHLTLPALSFVDELGRISNLKEQSAQKKEYERAKKDVIALEKFSFFPLPKPETKEVVYFLDVSLSLDFHPFEVPNAKSFSEYSVEALQKNVALLRPDVKVAIVTFDGEARVLYGGWFDRTKGIGDLSYVLKTGTVFTQSANKDYRTQENFFDAFHGFIKMFGHNSEREYQVQGDFAWEAAEIDADKTILREYGKQIQLNAFGDVVWSNYFLLRGVSNGERKGTYFQPAESDRYYQSAKIIQDLESKIPNISQISETENQLEISRIESLISLKQAEQAALLQKMINDCKKQNP